VVNDFVSLRAALVSADSMLGPGNLVNSAEEQVVNIAGLYECIEPQARARLFEIGALFAEFCGWLADDLGKFDSGKAWSAQALEWAHSSGNADIAAYILMRMSQQAQFARRRVQASALAQASIDYETRVGNSQVLAAIHQQAAHANAMDGQERAALLHMDKAYALTEATVSVDDAYALANYCTSSYVAVQRAAVLSTLGKHKRALDEYDRVMSGWPRSYRRERGLHLARRAAVAARAGLPEEALESGREALDIARATRSYRTVRELSSTVKLMQPWKAVQGVETFIRSVQIEGNVDGSA
jgi:tetratricopeptide (TPR) repeat protein